MSLKEIEFALLESELPLMEIDLFIPFGRYFPLMENTISFKAKSISFNANSIPFKDNSLTLV